MHRITCPLVLCMASLLALPVHSQTTQFAHPCWGSSVQKTINICTPISGVSTNVEFLVRARINDVDSVTWTLSLDGSKFPSYSGTGRDVIVQLGFLGAPFQGWHRVTITAKNASSSYSRTTWVKTTNDQICPMPTTTNSIEICSPLPAEGVMNPVHIAAAANYPNPRALVIYVDGVKAARNSTENNGTGLNVSQYLILNPGTHKIAVQARNADDVAVVAKTTTIVVLR